MLYLLQGNLVVPASANTPGRATAAPAPLAAVFWDNPLTRPPSVGTAPRTILFSGWFEADPDPEGDTPSLATDPRRGIFPRSHRTWGPAAWSALDALCDGLAPVLSARGATACFRPHARHILADPQSCLAFLRRREGQPFEVLLDPAAYFTPEMLPRAEDHLTRAFEALAGHPRTAALLLTNLEPAAEGSGGGLLPAPLSRGGGERRGGLDTEVLISLARRHAAHLPWILLDGDLDAQLALMR
jgi:hypothetical protein